VPVPLTFSFPDGNGSELAGSLVVINTPERYGGYLDNCIATALYAIRCHGKPAHLPDCRLPQEASALSPAGP